MLCPLMLPEITGDHVHLDAALAVVVVVLVVFATSNGAPFFFCPEARTTFSTFATVVSIGSSEVVGSSDSDVVVSSSDFEVVVTFVVGSSGFEVAAGFFSAVVVGVVVLEGLDSQVAL